MACSTPCDPSATPAPVTTTPEIMCCKCRTLPSTILVRRSKYCRYKSTILIPSPCFLGSIPGRFRTNLTRCQNIGARPLLAISGGASSTTLLHLLNNGQDEEDVRRRKYESVRVVHIDDGGIDTEAIRANARLTAPHIPELTIISSPHTISSKSPDAKSSRLRATRLKLLIKYAEENSCTSILFGDTSTALAVSSIAETAMGMGAGFIADKGVETEWYGVPVARPIRDVSAKEVALYCYFNTLPTVGETEKDRGNSIARLTQDFLLGLDKEFPSTLMTINRTLGKVQPGDGGRCGDCGGVVVEDCDVWARRRTVRGVGGDGEEIVEGDGERVRGVCYGCLLVRKHLVEE